MDNPKDYSLFGLGLPGDLVFNPWLVVLFMFRYSHYSRACPVQNTLLRCLIVTWLASVCGVVWALGFFHIARWNRKGVVGVPQLTYPYYI